MLPRGSNIAFTHHGRGITETCMLLISGQGNAIFDNQDERFGYFALYLQHDCNLVRRSLFLSQCAGSRCTSLLLSFLAMRLHDT